MVIQYLHYDYIIPKGVPFSIFTEPHLEQAVALFKLFYYAKDFETFFEAAVVMRKFVNEGKSEMHSKKSGSTAIKDGNVHKTYFIAQNRNPYEEKHFFWDFQRSVFQLDYFNCNTLYNFFMCFISHNFYKKFTCPILCVCEQK